MPGIVAFSLAPCDLGLLHQGRLEADQGPSNGPAIMKPVAMPLWVTPNLPHGTGPVNHSPDCAFCTWDIFLKHLSTQRPVGRSLPLSSSVMD